MLLFAKIFPTMQEWIDFTQLKFYENIAILLFCDGTFLKKLISTKLIS